MKLYYAPGTIAAATIITLHEAGVAFEAVKVDFANAEQTKPEYLKLNPKGRVPALVTDDGKILTETGALLEYVAALAPQAGLVPTDMHDAAHMRSVMYYLASTMHVAHAHKMRGHRWASKETSFEDMRAKVTENMNASAAFVQSECLRGTYVLGDDFSVADPYLFAVCNWLEGDGVTLAEYPSITTFMESMPARESVNSARAAGML